MHRYINVYYIFNLLALLSYPLFRLYIQSYRLKEHDTFGYTRENGILCTALALLYIRWKKSATVDHFLQSIFIVGKVAFCVLFAVIDLKFGLYYAFACMLLFLFTRQPKYAGPSHMLSLTSEEQFNDLVLKSAKKTAKRAGENEYSQKNMYLVEFFLDWAETCIYTKPIWTEYSNKYTTQNLRFAEVNLATIPDLAKKYNINTTALSRQLPTLIMFEDGKEVIRFPPYDEKAKVYMKVVKYHKKEIAKYFDLEERYLATRFNDVPVKQKNEKNDKK